MSDWTGPDFLDKLKTAVAARNGITSLDPAPKVITYFPVPEDLNSGDTIILGWRISDTAEEAALGQGAYDENVDVDCQIRVVRPGAGETQAKAARDRAMNILGEIDNQLRTTPPSVGRQTLRALVAERDMAQYAYKSGSAAVRICRIELTIRYLARTERESS